jgi:hypothetical protein
MINSSPQFQAWVESAREPAPKPRKLSPADIIDDDIPFAWAAIALPFAMLAARMLA